MALNDHNAMIPKSLIVILSIRKGKDMNRMTLLREPDKNLCFRTGRTYRPVIADHQDFENRGIGCYHDRGKIGEKSGTLSEANG
jgi:hypothetical protein